jgi:NRPS condensation-like uncharacterized protein
MSKHSTIPIPEDGIQWNCWIVPNYDEKQSLLVWKSHHVLGDGIGFMLMLSIVTDGGYEKKNFIQTTAVLPPWKRAVLFLLKPFTALYAAIFFATWPAESNCIRKGGDIKLDGVKKNAVCKAMHVPTLKKAVAKYNKSTINDLVMAMAAVACKKYMLKRGED